MAIKLYKEVTMLVTYLSMFSSMYVEIKAMTSTRQTKQQCADLFDGEKKYFPCGEIATMRLAQIIGRNKVECTNEGKDKYKRQLSYCYVNGENINRRMVREGYAFAYSEYDRTFVLDELIARIIKDGLWNSEFEKPSDWRKKQKQNKSK